MNSPPATRTPGFLPHARLQDLLDALEGEGYQCVGPTLTAGAIVYQPLHGAADLPCGVADTQAPGAYHVAVTGSARRFSWANGPQALKPFLFAAREVLWRSTRRADGHLGFAAVEADRKPLAVIGVRACDLAALELQDKHFRNGTHPDAYYARRREGLFIVAVHCSHPADTCFCVSTGDGPRATHGFDLALSELDDGFIAVAGSDKAQALLAKLDLASATPAQLAQAADQSQRAAMMQTRQLAGGNLRDRLFANLEHPRWIEVAERCLSCGNCTSVCPTCFCHSEADVPQLDGAQSDHVREWDSCFTHGHSHIHGFTVRADTRTRYRQWLTHKLGSWHEQYGRSGCVGCGRCITWCPVGIDITEEANAIVREER